MLLAALGGTGAHAASPGAPTRGDAEGIFQASFTGGSAIRAHNQLAAGVPAEPINPNGARIYPLQDDLEYCQQGWHVVDLLIFDDRAFFGGNQELFDYLAGVEVRFVLDGVPLETERTAIKRVPHPDPIYGLDEAFGIAFGAFLAPGSLSVGSHELQTLIDDPLFGDFDFTTPFTVVSC